MGVVIIAYCPLLARRSIIKHGRRYTTVTKQNSLLEDIVIRFSKAYKSLSGGASNIMGVAATPNRTFVAYDEDHILGRWFSLVQGCPPPILLHMIEL